MPRRLSDLPPLHMAIAVLALCLASGCGERPPPADPEPRTSTRASAAAARAAMPAEKLTPAAQLPADPQRLTRHECLRLALANNRTLLLRRSAVARARQGRTIASSQVYVPRLTADYTVANHADAANAEVGMLAPLLGFDLHPFVSLDYLQNGNPEVDREANLTTYGITVSRRLFALSESRRQHLPITTADRDFLVAANNLVLEGRQLELETVRAFLNIERFQRRVKVFERGIVGARAFLAAIRDDVNHGFKAPVEELFASIYLSTAELRLVDERPALQSAKEQLMQVLALPITTPFEIVEEDVATVAVPAPALEEDVKRSLAHHESLGNQAADIDLELDQLRIQRDLLAPQVTAALTAAHQISGPNAFESRSGEENLIALNLNYVLPLDGNREARARYQQLQDEIEERLIALRNAEADIEQRLRAASRRIAAQSESMRLGGDLVAAQEGRRAATLNRYKAGIGDNLELTRAQGELDSAEINLIDAQIELVIAGAEYRALVPTAVSAPAVSPAPGAQPAPAPATP